MGDAQVVTSGQGTDLWKQSLAPTAINIALLVLAALTTLPYAFYVFLRLVTTGNAIHLAICARSARKMLWVWLLAGVAVTFNPILPLKMGRSDWECFNWGTAFLLGLWLAVASGIFSAKKP